MDNSQKDSREEVVYNQKTLKVIIICLNNLERNLSPERITIFERSFSPVEMLDQVYKRTPIGLEYYLKHVENFKYGYGND
jgi:hypothetical protein